MSHISIYRIRTVEELKETGAISRALEHINQQAAKEAEARKKAEQLVLSELRRNFLELAERQEDAAGNLRLLLKVNQKATPNKTGNVEVLIKTDNTLTIDVSNAPGQTCKALTQPLEMALGTPISVHYKPEYHDGKVRLKPRIY